MPESPRDQMQKLLASMSQIEASDLHLKVGYPPYFRVLGVLRGTKMPPIADSRTLEEMLHDLVPEERRRDYIKTGCLDFSAQGATGDRFRINMFRSTGETHAAIRRVQSEIPSFSDLALPDVYREVVEKSRDGLILVSGVTGCGKSSTLAAMVDHINATRSANIVTIEDPVEFLFKPKKSIVSQREIGIDVPDFSEALRHVVRQDPDCIMIGELRDKETMMAAIQAAETGHLVLGSLHVSDVQQTFTRILEFFPREEHAFIRSSMASSIRAITCQKLLPGIEKGSLYPATEVLLNNIVVRDKILREKDEELPGIITQGRADGMRSFTFSLCELIEQEKVHFDTAMEFAPNRDALAAAVKGIKAG
ncbi:MAG: PilT/PilU family type 4a pilus ATPase [Planctomycetes bacterium]|nr:PilT/PilU family type 4a pilus ATPase [Planctomycetota bacterium]